MRNRLRWLAPLLSLTLLIAACGDDAAPDHGDYALEPVVGDYDDAPNTVRGTLVESARIGERLLFADRIDPELTSGDGGGLIVGILGVDDLLSGVQRSALGPFDVLAGYGAIASNGQSDNEAKHKLLSIVVLSLPDELQATAAAQAMAAADFTANTENAPLVLPEYPAALSHWRPGVPTVGSWLVWKNLVIRLYAKIIEPSPELLSDLLTRTYRAQLAELDTFAPTPAADVPKLKLDSDKLLTHVVKTGDYWPDKWDFMVYGPRSYALLRDNPSAELGEFAQSSIDAVAVSYNKFLFRARDSEAAKTYADAKEKQSLAADYTPMPGPAGLSGISCYRAARPDNSSIPARRFSCLVRHNEYVVRLYSNQEIDIRQQAVAQHALLSGSW
ncbi:hypothetical protein DFR71_1905 [Nocardia alba]|uniref:Uncharacterized protein n=1 Tax=Nocardia alba TaxID=225051 RepID=A0A4R1G2M2_9NOCA|nr:hypothetical protein DFR71_1905 [Nocardia alba]